MRRFEIKVFWEYATNKKHKPMVEPNNLSLRLPSKCRHKLSPCYTVTRKATSQNIQLSGTPGWFPRGLQLPPSVSSAGAVHCHALPVRAAATLTRLLDSNSYKILSRCPDCFILPGQWNPFKHADPSVFLPTGVFCPCYRER